jgi:hypothetical protein
LRGSKLTSMDKLISGICSAGIILFCESEYACLRLFKRKTTLFFFVCQLAICLSALETALSILLYFLPDLRVLPMFVIILITRYMKDVSYPVMILLRLRFIYNFSVIIIYIPVVLTLIIIVLRFSWIKWVLTGESYYFNIIFIVQPIITTLYVVQCIVINIFFIVIAIKHFQNVFHIRCVVIVNIIVIVLGCVEVLIEILIINKWIVLCVISIVAQIRVRLEIEVLSYIVESARERRNVFSLT